MCAARGSWLSRALVHGGLPSPTRPLRELLEPLALSWEPRSPLVPSGTGPSRMARH